MKYQFKPHKGYIRFYQLRTNYYHVSTEPMIALVSRLLWPEEKQLAVLFTKLHIASFKP